MDPQDSQAQSPSPDSPEASLPAHQADYEGGSDPAAEAMEWVRTQREAGKNPIEQVGTESTESDDGGDSEQSTEPVLRRATDTPQAEKPAEPRQEDKPKASALANFHRRQQEFEAQRQAFNREKQENQKALDALKNAKVDRIAALEAMGYSDVKSFLEGLAEDGGRMTPERREIQELRQWRDSQEKQAQTARESQEQQNQQRVLQQKLDEIRTDVQTKLKSESYSTRLVNISGADEAVMLEMDKMASETGEMPRIEDAMETVEGRFRENLKALSDNPEVRKFFQEILKSTQKAPSPSKPKGKLSTIGSDARSPGVAHAEEYVPSVSGEREIQEALAFLEKRRARR